MRHLLVAAAALSLLAGPALAKHDDHGRGWGPPGHAGHVPPGLAKKPYGLPPGQAKKMWRQGQYLPRTYIVERYYIVEPVRYRLAPPRPGYRWVHVDDDAYQVQTRTGLISQVVANLFG